MFHLARRSPKLSTRATHAQAHTSRFAWAVAALSGVVLVAAMALFPLQAAAAPSRQAGAFSSSTHPPLLKLVPKVVDPDHPNFYCQPHFPPGAFCHVRLTETLGSSGPLHWFTRADVSLKPHPSSGNLSPGQSVEVMITVNRSTCLGGPSVYFIGPKNLVSVEVFCD